MVEDRRRNKYKKRSGTRTRKDLKKTAIKSRPRTTLR